MRTVIAFILSETAEVVCYLLQVYSDYLPKLKLKYPKLTKNLKTRVFLIRGTNEDRDKVYLKRYVVWYSEGFRLYLHIFCQSDQRDTYHSHPWSASFLHLRNTYTEEVLVNHPHIDPELQKEVLKQGFGWFKLVTYGRKLLQVTTIDRSHIHRVQLDKEYHDCPRQAPLTLAWSGKRAYTTEGEDDWGFWTVLDTEPGQGIGIPLYQYTHWKESVSKSLDTEVKASH